MHPLAGNCYYKMKSFKKSNANVFFLFSGGTTDSDSRPQLQGSGQNVAGVPTERLVSKMPACRPPPRAPAPTTSASKEKVVKKEEAVVGSNKEVVVEEEEEEKEEEKLPPAMNAMDPAKRLDRLVSFLKL